MKSGDIVQFDLSLLMGESLDELELKIIELNSLTNNFQFMIAGKSNFAYANTYDLVIPNYILPLLAYKRHLSFQDGWGKNWFKKVEPRCQIDNTYFKDAVFLGQSRYCDFYLKSSELIFFDFKYPDSPQNFALLSDLNDTLRDSSWNDLKYGARLLACHNLWTPNEESKRMLFNFT